MVNTIISWVVFAAVITYFTVVILVFCLANHKWEEKVKFIKNFKLGKWSALFLICIPLFVIGYMSNGNPVDDSIFRAFTSTFKLLTLSLDFDFVLTNTNIAFKVALYTCYVASILNDLLIATSLLLQTVYNWFKGLKLKLSRKDTCIIIGNNEKSAMIYNSSSVKCLIADVMNNEKKEELFLKKIAYHGSANEEGLIKYIQKQLIKHGKKIQWWVWVKNSNKVIKWLFRFNPYAKFPRLRIIVNTNNDDDNIRLIDKISSYVNKTYWTSSCLEKVEYNKFAPAELTADEFADVKKYRDKLLKKFKYTKVQIQTLDLALPISKKPNDPGFKENQWNIFQIKAKHNFVLGNLSLESVKQEIAKIELAIAEFKTKNKKYKDDEDYKDLVDKLEKFKVLLKELTEIKEPIKKYYKTHRQNILSNLLNHSDIYSFGDINYQDNYEKYELISKGCIHYVNSQTLIAKEFVTKYPLALQLKSEHVDYSTGLVKDKVKVNVAFIGFGKKNQQLFLSMLATNQLMCKSNDGDIKQFDVNYQFYDKDGSLNNKNLTNYGFRYKHEFIDSNKTKDPKYEQKYFVAPNFPFLEDFNKRIHGIDINSHDFYDELRKQICPVEDEIDSLTVNYIIISLGNDEETTDAATKIVGKLTQWRTESNTYVYAGIDAESVNNNKGLFDFGTFKHFNTFGCESLVVYNYDSIVDDFYTRLAVKEKAIYDSLWGNKFVRPTQFSYLTDKHFANWNKYVLYDRMSSLYAVLSINHKLLLMGKQLRFTKENKLITTLNEFNEAFGDYLKAYWGDRYNGTNKYVEVKDKDGKVIDQYFEINSAVAKSVVIAKFKGVKALKEEHAKDKRITKTDFIWYYRDETKFDDSSLRTNMAKLEHERWNCYTMFQGFVPLSRNDIERYGSQKHIETREHACLTTFKGLEQLQEFLVEKGIRKTKWDAEYKHYDYQLMDSLPLLLLNEPVKIVGK